MGEINSIHFIWAFELIKQTEEKEVEENFQKINRRVEKILYD